MKQTATPPGARPVPDFAAERAISARLGLTRIAGVDEAGRGPWAGPVVAGAAILDPASVPDGIRDSKALSPQRREAVLALLLGVAEIGIGEASVGEIDSLGLGPAADLAMVRALAALPAPPEAVLVDGNRLPRGLSWPGEAVVGGDRLSLSVAAASIAAKVARDRIMADLAAVHPGYGWERNAGYGTAEHRAALMRLGVTSAHRRSFRPIHNILCEESGPNA